MSDRSIDLVIKLSIDDIKNIINKLSESDKEELFRQLGIQSLVYHFPRKGVIKK